MAPAGRAPLSDRRLPGVSCAVALPVALWLGHVGRGGALAVNISNVGRAVPTFAVLVLLTLSPLGKQGDWPTIIALVLFALPPLLTNAYVGMREADRDVVEAARGMGMSGPAVAAPGRDAARLPADHDGHAVGRGAGRGDGDAGRAARRRRPRPHHHGRLRQLRHPAGGGRRGAGRRARAAGGGRAGAGERLLDPMRAPRHGQGPGRRRVRRRRRRPGTPEAPGSASTPSLDEDGSRPPTS